jgi:hypothetical protein
VHGKRNRDRPFSIIGRRSDPQPALFEAHPRPGIALLGSDPHVGGATG